jgi:hypothetical protein
MQREAVASCPSCQHHYCRECITEHEDIIVCRHCLASQIDLQPKEPSPFISYSLGFVEMSVGLVILLSSIYFYCFLFSQAPKDFHDGEIWTPFLQVIPQK